MQNRRIDVKKDGAFTNKDGEFHEGHYVADGHMGYLNDDYQLSADDAEEPTEPECPGLDPDESEWMRSEDRRTVSAGSGKR